MNKEKEQVSLPWFGIPKLFPYLKPYKGILISMIITTLLCCVIDIILPLFQRYALNYFIEANTLKNLKWFIIAYAVVLIAQVITSLICTYQACQIEMYVGRDMKRESFNHLQTLAFSYFNQNSVGYIHARVMSDTNRIASMVSWALFDSIWHIAYIVGAVVVMLSINWRLALWVIVIVPITALGAAFFQKK